MVWLQGFDLGCCCSISSHFWLVLSEYFTNLCWRRAKLEVHSKCIKQPVLSDNIYQNVNLATICRLLEIKFTIFSSIPLFFFSALNVESYGFVNFLHFPFHFWPFHRGSRKREITYPPQKLSSGLVYPNWGGFVRFRCWHIATDLAAPIYTRSHLGCPPLRVK